MKIYSKPLFIILIIIYANVIRAQIWTEVNPPPNIFNKAIYSVATDAASNVYAAGLFKNAGNKNIVVKWDGDGWSELGSGATSLNANNPIYCVATDRSGNVYAAGGFTNTSGYYYVAKWNGTNWSQTGAPNFFTNGSIYAMAVDTANNNLYVAGGFRDNNNKWYVAKWDGTSWSQLGTGAAALNANGIIYSLAIDGVGNVYTAGYFTNSANKCYVAKWNGFNWTELGTTVPLNANDAIRCIQVDNAGNAYATGSFRNSSNEYYVAKYNGSSWAEIGSGANAIHANGPINSIAVKNANEVYAAGYGTNINGGTNTVKWNGTNWGQVFEVEWSVNNSIRSIILDNAGNLYAGGDFQNAYGHNYVAIWNGTSKQELGRQGEFLRSGNGIKQVMPDIYGKVYVIGAVWPNGTWTTEPGEWDGVGWTPMKNHTLPISAENINTMTTDLAGNIYGAGGFVNANGEIYIGKWNGSDWIEIPGTASLRATGAITSLTADSSGNLYATGPFVVNSIIYGIAKWNGTSWSHFASPGDGIRFLVPGPDENVYVAGWFNNSGKYYVAKVGPNYPWSELGTGVNALNAGALIYTIAKDRSGNLYAGGLFENSQHDAYVAKWNGTSWSQLGALPGANQIHSIAADSAGNVFASVGSDNALHPEYVTKWNGSSWIIPDSNYFLGNQGAFFSIANDIRGNVYAAGFLVAAYGNSILKLQLKPINLCSGGGGILVASPGGSNYQWQVSTDSVNFTSITDNVNYSGTNNDTLILTNMSSASYGSVYRAIVNGGVRYESYVLKFKNTWTGAVNGAWENPANWSCGIIPDSNTDVVIGGNCVVSANTTIRTLTLKSSASFNVVPGVVLTILH